MIPSNVTYPYTRLTADRTVADYLAMEASEDKTDIADLIYERFAERYISPLKLKSHGFAIMAVCCLMIEALQSFREGRATTKRLGRKVFGRFFDQSPHFSIFAPVSDDFYDHIRCGILHQAETTDGWRITRDKVTPLLDRSGKVINARLFQAELQDTLSEYCQKLRQADWNSKLWRNARTKMKSICDHCKP